MLYSGMGTVHERTCGIVRKRPCDCNTVLATYNETHCRFDGAMLEVHSCVEGYECPELIHVIWCPLCWHETEI